MGKYAASVWDILTARTLFRLKTQRAKKAQFIHGAYSFSVSYDSGDTLRSRFAESALAGSIPMTESTKAYSVRLPERWILSPLL